MRYGAVYEDNAIDDNIIVQILMHKSCNLNCPYCVEWNTRKSDSHYMIDVDKFKKEFAQFVKNYPEKTFDFYIMGGEVFINMDMLISILNILMPFNSKTNSITLYTNGLLFSPEVTQQLNLYNLIFKNKLNICFTWHPHVSIDMLEYVLNYKGDIEITKNIIIDSYERFQQSYNDIIKFDLWVSPNIFDIDYFLQDNIKLQKLKATLSKDNYIQDDQTINYYDSIDFYTVTNKFNFKGTECVAGKNNILYTPDGIFSCLNHKDADIHKCKSLTDIDLATTICPFDRCICEQSLSKVGTLTCMK